MIQSGQPLVPELLGHVADSLDVPAELQRQAAVEYDDLGRFLKTADREEHRREPDVFPQGSVSTGTVVQPIVRKDDFDVDLVYVRPTQSGSTTQSQLMSDTRRRLGTYLEGLASRGKPRPTIKPKPRCWALEYSKFHIDVVPMIPEVLSNVVDGRLLISDRDEHEWQLTDPRGYRDWFLSRTRFQELRERFARDEGRPVEQVPVWEIKTPLQRGVQVLKRHRDWHFRTQESALKPSSIALATIAAENCAGGGTLEQVVTCFCQKARSIERRDGEAWVRNPTIEDENFLRAWKDDKRLEPAFFSWVQALEIELGALAESRGLDKAGTRLCEMFGNELADAALKGLGNSRLAAREAGALKVSSAGTLGSTGVASVARHTFHGLPKIP